MELMKIDPNSAGTAAIWSHFVTPWLAWNHIRTLTSIGGMASLIIALRAS
jgi:uncharacterized membrane protein